jgi:hypothetical protein
MEKRVRRAFKFEASEGGWMAVDLILGDVPEVAPNGG